MIDLKFRLTKTVKSRRLCSKLTQQDVVKMIKSSQSRIAKIESGSGEVSIDLLIRYLFAVGGRLEELELDALSKAKNV